MARRIGRKAGVRAEGTRHVSTVSADAVTPEVAFEELSKFCRSIGGEPYSRDAEHVSTVGWFECWVARGMDNKDIALLITSEIPKRLHLLKALKDSPLTEFELNLGDKTIKYQLGGTVTAETHTIIYLDVDPAKIKYAYPDHVEDMTKDENAEITVWAKGFKVGDNVYADLHGKLLFLTLHPRNPKLVEEKLNEFDKIIDEIIENPRNLFKMKE